jgi:hypothetical protein
MPICIKGLAVSETFFMAKLLQSNSPLNQSREAEKERKLSFKLEREVFL